MTYNPFIRWLRYASLGLLGIIFGVVAAILLDYIITSLSYQNVTDEEKSKIGCVIPHQQRHHAFKPLCSGVNKWGSSGFPVFTNSLGLRDQSMRVVSNKAEKKRILFVGDSFTDGLAEWRDTFVGMFQAAFPNFEVLNGGLGSYSPSNYYLLAADLIAQSVQIDEIVVMIDISDIQDEAAIYSSQSEGTLNFRNAIVHDRSIQSQLEDWIVHHLNTVGRIIWSRRKASILGGQYTISSSWSENIFDAARSSWTYLPESEAIFQRPAYSGYSPLGVVGGRRKAREKMTKLFELVNSKGIPLSVGVYPWPGTLVHDVKESRGVTEWREWCSGRCRKFIDTFPSFFEQKEICSKDAPGCWYEKLFIFGDVHYTKLGNELVAKELIHAFRKTGHN